MTEGLPAVVDLTAYHGDTWTQTFRLKSGTKPVNLTGATVASWARHDSGSVLHLAAAVTNPTAGELQLSVGTDGLPVGAYTYDVEVQLSGVVTTWIRGALIVRPDITNAA